MNAELRKAPEEETKAIELTRAQRAAVIFSLLSDSLSGGIVENLDESVINLIAQTMETVPTLSSRELTLVIVDFLSSLQDVSGGVMGGEAMAQKFLGSFAGPPKDDDSDDANDEDLSENAIDPAVANTVWGRLAALPPVEVAEYLNSLPANLVAVVLRRVEPAFAAEVVGNLREERLSQSLSALLSDEKSDPEIEALVERVVEEELLAGDGDEESGDDEEIGQLGELLSLLPSNKRSKLMDFLRDQHATKLEVVEKQMIDVTELPTILPVKYVPVLVREFEDAELIDTLVVLKANYGDVFEFVIGNISSRLADSIRIELEEREAFSEEQSDEIVRRFTSRLLDLRRNDVISLER